MLSIKESSRRTSNESTASLSIPTFLHNATPHPEVLQAVNMIDLYYYDISGFIEINVFIICIYNFLFAAMSKTFLIFCLLWELTFFKTDNLNLKQFTAKTDLLRIKPNIWEPWGNPAICYPAFIPIELQYTHGIDTYYFIQYCNTKYDFNK